MQDSTTASLMMPEGASAEEEPPGSSSWQATPFLAASKTSPQPEGSAPPRRSEWVDWRWQMRNRIRTVGQLVAKYPALQNLAAIAEAAATLFQGDAGFDGRQHEVPRQRDKVRQDGQKTPVRQDLTARRAERVAVPPLQRQSDSTE